MTKLKDILKENEDECVILSDLAVFMISQADFTIACQLLDTKMELPTNESTGNPGKMA